MSYTPPQEVLDKYASILINYALGGGTGIKPGEVVLVSIPESAKPLYAPLRNCILKSGGNPIIMYSPSDVSARDTYELASEEQLGFFPDKYYKGLIDQIDHHVMIIAEADKHELQGIDPAKMMIQSKAVHPYREWRNKKELAGAFTWVIGMYGTPAMAEDVSLSEEEYWDQIIAACYLDAEDPIAKWKEISAELESYREALSKLDIETLHVKGDDIDLNVQIGPNRTWLGGGGRNIPSFEIFTSPNWKGTEGWVRFNQPLYVYGTVVEGIRLEFKDGVVVNASATKNENVIKEMIAVPGGNRIGEFSLTDTRFSRITKVMGETLFDENMGGPNGNMHIALGNSYKDTYPGDAEAVSDAEWEEWGYNVCALHTDIVTTTPRTVTATLSDGTERVIYDEGKFVLDDLTSK